MSVTTVSPSAVKFKQSQLFSRGNIMRWLRNTHGWLGLWGAALGLLFGATGILLNHRQVMKLPYAQYEIMQMELALPSNEITTVEGLSHWLQSTLHIEKAPYKADSEPIKEIIWNGIRVKQPALWKVDFHTPQYSLLAEYWVGNEFVSVKRQDANVFAFLNRLHKGVGMNTGWILLVDTLAGALIMLSLTGILLWTKMRRSRLVLTGLTGGSIVLAVFFSMTSI
jgi:uncharacterized protein